MLKIMVDSSSDLAKEDNIYDISVPITVTVDDKDYKAGVDLQNDTFYRLLTETKSFPQTAQPQPSMIISEFENVRDSGDEVIYFTLSSGLSGTYQTALMAKEMVGYDKIYIIDTLLATHLIDVLVRHAVQMRDNGFTAEEIVAECEELKTRIKVFAGLDTLEFLRRGGRLGAASAAIGTLANIKPIITITEQGTVEAIGKALGKGKAIQFILDKVTHAELDEDYPLYPLYSYGEENTILLEEKLEQNGFTLAERKQIGPTIGAHLGPGVYAVIVVLK